MLNKKKKNIDTSFCGAKNKLEAKNLQKTYGDKLVVKDLSMEVNCGEVVGLLGPNGAGKTTSFYMIMGLIKADKGKIRMNGMTITAIPMYQRARMGIGYLPQETSIFRGMTVEENIYSILEVSESDKKVRVRRLKNLLEEFSINHIRKSPALALSGGERRRVEIARALAADPQFILLDEPFTGIDPIAIQDIQEQIKRLTQRGIGILITDHNPKATLNITNRANIIFDGQIKVSGTSYEVAQNTIAKQYYLGEDFEL